MLLSELRNLIKERIIVEGLIDDIKKEFPGREVEWDQAKSELLQNGVKENQLAQYLKWLWKQAKGTQEPIGDIVPLVVTFNKIREKGSIWEGSKDINAWTRDSLQNEIERLPKPQDKEKKKEREGADYVTNSSKWSIYIPMDEAESIQISHMGGEKSTNWCTSRTSGNLYYAYILGDAVLYYVLSTKNPTEKYCIGAKNGEIVVQGAGGVTVTKTNAAFTDPMQKKAFKNDYQEIINFIKNHCSSIGGKHPAKRNIEEAATSLPKLKYMMKGWRVTDMAVLLMTALKKMKFSKDCLLWMIDNHKDFQQALDSTKSGYNFFYSIKTNISEYSPFTFEELEVLNQKYQNLGFRDSSARIFGLKYTKNPELFAKEFLESKSEIEKSLKLKGVLDIGNTERYGITATYHTDYDHWKPVVDFLINNFNDVKQYYDEKKLLRILSIYSKFLNNELSEKLGSIVELGQDYDKDSHDLKKIKVHNEIKKLMSGDHNTFKRAVEQNFQPLILSPRILSELNYADSNITKENLDYLLDLFDRGAISTDYNNQCKIHKSFLSQIMKFYQGDELDTLLANSKAAPDNVLSSLLINNLNNEEKFKKLCQLIINTRINSGMGQRIESMPIALVSSYIQNHKDVKIPLNIVNLMFDNPQLARAGETSFQEFLNHAVKNFSEEEIQLYKKNIDKFTHGLRAGEESIMPRKIAKSIVNYDIINIINDKSGDVTSKINQKIISYDKLYMSQFLNQFSHLRKYGGDLSKNDNLARIFLNAIVNRGFSNLENDTYRYYLPEIFQDIFRIYKETNDEQLILNTIKPETKSIEALLNTNSIGLFVEFGLESVVNNNLRYKLFKELARTKNQIELKTELYRLIGSKHDDKTIVTALTAIKEAGHPETVLKLINDFNNGARKKVILIRLQRNGWLDWFAQEMEKRNFMLESLYKRVFNRLQSYN